MTFKAGDRVILTRHISEHLKLGETATVTSVFERCCGKYVTVDWDQYAHSNGGWDLSRFKLIPFKMEDNQAFTLEELAEWQDTATNASNWVKHPNPPKGYPMACQLRIDEGSATPGVRPTDKYDCDRFANKQMPSPWFSLEEILACSK